MRLLLLSFEKSLGVVTLGIDADLDVFQAQTLVLQGFLKARQMFFQNVAYF